MTEKKTLVGVLASHDSPEKNTKLKELFDWCASKKETRKTLEQFAFVFTGGTYARLFEGATTAGQPQQPPKEEYELEDRTKEFLWKNGVVRLPTASDGGVTLLCALVTLRYVSIIWPFFTPRTTHLLFPENLALLRLADQWRAKKLMNLGSVREWLKSEAAHDANLNPQDLQIRHQLAGSKKVIEAEHVKKRLFRIRRPPSVVDGDYVTNSKQAANDSVIALISHDAMKDRMSDFVIDHEQELVEFQKILATGTTGKLVEDSAPKLAGGKVHKYNSDPKGGDVEIATEILFHGCQVVVFFVDPLHPHPHTEDIRVVFGACMVHDEVRMLSNEIQARGWMDRLLRSG